MRSMKLLEDIKKIIGSFQFRKKWKQFFNVSKKFFKYLLDLVGLRYIFLKLCPPVDPETNRRKPITLTLWIFGIYVASYGIASQRYENRIDIIENRASAVFAQLASPAYKQALARIPHIQHMCCPKKPDFLIPYTIFESLFAVYDIAPYPRISQNENSDKQSELLWNFRKKMFGVDGPYHEMVDLLKSTIADWKNSLKGLNLEGLVIDNANLEGADLSSVTMNDASLSHTFLNNVKFDDAHLWQSNFSNSFMEGASFRRAGLVNAQLANTRMTDVNLMSAVLDDANFKGANLKGANFENTSMKNVNFEGANLLNPKGLTVKQLITVFSLKNSKIPDLLLNQIENKYAFLFFDIEHRNKLQNFIFENLDLERSSFRNANLSNANLKNSNLYMADLSHANLKEADLSKSQLYNADLGGAILINSKLINANLSEANCWATDFSNTDFKEANLKGAMLRAAILHSVKNLTVDQICLAETIYEAKIDQAQRGAGDRRHHGAEEADPTDRHGGTSPVPPPCALRRGILPAPCGYVQDDEPTVKSEPFSRLNLYFLYIVIKAPLIPIS